MKLTGIKTQEVDVEITPHEMIRGLYCECGLEMVYLSKFYTSDRRWVLKELHETDDHKPVGISAELTAHQHPEQPVLIEEQNMSLNGNDNFYPTGRKISDPRKIKALKLLTELEKVIEEFENE